MDDNQQMTQNSRIAQQMNPNDVYRRLCLGYFFYIFCSCSFLTNQCFYLIFGF